MTKDIPFPPAIARMSAENARKSLESRSGSRRETTRNETGYAAYRTPEGRIRMAYDLYNPTYPEGSTPGLTRVNYVPDYSVNGFEGYKPYPFHFVPAQEFLRPDPLHAPGAPGDRYGSLAVAFVETDAGPSFLWAKDEDQMAAWIDGPLQDAKVLRPVLTFHGMDVGEEPGCAILIKSAVVTRLHIAASEAVLIDAMKDSFPDLPIEGASLSEVAELMREKGEGFGWTVFAQGYQEPVTKFGIRDPFDTLNMEFATANGFSVPGKTPVGALIRSPQHIRMAVISESRGADAIIVHAWDDEALSRRVANILIDLMGEGEGKRFDHFDGNAWNFVNDVVENGTGIKVIAGDGRGHAAYGYDFSKYLIAQDLGSEKVTGVASSSKNNLVMAARDAFVRDTDAIDCDTDDIDDVVFLITDEEEMSPSAMSLDDLDDRIERMRSVLRHSSSPNPY